MKQSLFDRVSVAFGRRGWYRVFYTLCVLGIVAFFGTLSVIAGWVLSFDSALAWELVAYAWQWPARLTPYVTPLLLLYIAYRQMPGETNFSEERVADSVLACPIIIGTSLAINGIASGFAAMASVTIVLPGSFALVVIPLAIMGALVSMLLTLYFRDRSEAAALER